MTWQPDYCTTADLKEFLRIGVLDDNDDVQLALAITAASRSIDRACNRQFGVVSAAEPRFYTARWDTRRYRWIVDIDDLMSVTDLAVDADLDWTGGFTSSIADYDLKPLNASAEGKPWTQVVIRPDADVVPDDTEDGVRITAVWGWSSVPSTIKQATLLQANRIMMRRDSPYGIAGSPETGSEMRLLAKVDPDVDLMLRPFRSVWGAV